MISITEKITRLTMRTCALKISRFHCVNSWDSIDLVAPNNRLKHRPICTQTIFNLHTNHFQLTLNSVHNVETPLTVPLVRSEKNFMFETHDQVCIECAVDVDSLHKWSLCLLEASEATHLFDIPSIRKTFNKASEKDREWQSTHFDSDKKCLDGVSVANFKNSKFGCGIITPVANYSRLRIVN